MTKSVWSDEKKGGQFGAESGGQFAPEKRGLFGAIKWGLFGRNFHFTSEKGYDYSIQIISESNGCFESVPMAYQCIGTTEDGGQCEHLTDNPNGLCWQHQDQE